MFRLTYSSIVSTLFLACLTYVTATGQSNKSYDIGLEIQAYPTGVIPGLHFEYGLSDKNGLFARVGYNIVNHRDLGVQDNEKGGGFGFSVGYRRYFKADRQGFFLGARADLWFNKIDWKENPNLITEVQGRTEITVFQPTAEAGYVVDLKKGNWSFVPSIAFGAEINVKTSGRPVGEGAVLLLGFTFRKRF